MAQRGKPGKAAPPPPRKSSKRALLLTVLAAVVFAAVVVARLPASWVLPAAGRELRCASVAGSVWDGYCGGAEVSGTPLGNLTWQLRPGRLLSGELAARVQAIRADASARADVAIGLGGIVMARNVRIDLPLEPALVPTLPSFISGKATASLERLEITRTGAVKRIQGHIEIHHLVDSSGQVTRLGSFLLTFPGAAGEPVGRLRDLGGPVAVEGTLRLTAQPGYVLNARVAARSDASPSLLNALRYLGTPDAEGWRPFALAGTY